MCINPTPLSPEPAVVVEKTHRRATGTPNSVESRFFFFLLRTLEEDQANMAACSLFLIFPLEHLRSCSSELVFFGVNFKCYGNLGLESWRFSL
jgi:hypothetical protein